MLYLFLINIVMWSGRLQGTLCQTHIQNITKLDFFFIKTATTQSTTTLLFIATTSVGGTSAGSSLCSASSELQCFNGGSCVVLNHSLEVCLCPDDYSGERCEKKKKGNVCIAKKCFPLWNNMQNFSWKEINFVE